MVKKYSEFTNIIQGAVKRAGLTMLSLAGQTGIPYPTLNRRLKDPGSWRGCELAAVIRVAPFNESEKQALFAIMEGGELRK